MASPEPRTRRTGPQEAGSSGSAVERIDSRQSITYLPIDEAAEDSLLAELADPLTESAALYRKALDLLGEGINLRIAQLLVDRHEGGLPPVRGDVEQVRDCLGETAYVRLREAVRSAWPLYRTAYEALVDLAERRARLLDLEIERLRLLEGAPT